MIGLILLRNIGPERAEATTAGSEGANVAAGSIVAAGGVTGAILRVGLPPGRPLLHRTGWWARMARIAKEDLA